MQRFQIKKGSTSVILPVSVFDSSSAVGAKLAGLVYNTSGLTAYYNRMGAAGAAVAIALATATKGTWATGGFVAIDGTNMPGDYELHIPDAALATGANLVLVQLKGAANMVPVNFLIELVAVDLQDAVRAGLTALPNAAAEAAGGLYTRGSGVGQINQPANGQIDANAVKLGGTAQTGRDIGASVLLSAGTGTGQLDITSGVVKANLVQILATALTETAGYLAAGFKKFFNVATPVHTVASVDQSGDGYARVGAPAGASLAADVAAVKGDTANIYLDTHTNGVVLPQAQADKVWSTAARALTDKAGFALSAAGVQAIWDALTSALTAAGSIGKKLADWVIGTAQTGDAYARIGAAGAGLTALGDTRLANLDATVSSRAPEAAGNLAAVKAKTDNLPASPAAVGSAMILTSAYDAAKNAAPESGGNIAAIKAKTDNLPGDPADESLIIAATDAIMGRLGAPVGASVVADLVAVKSDTGAIKAKTDNLPASPAATGDIPSAAMVADQVWNETLADHLAAGSTGAKLNGASAPAAAEVAAAVWEEPITDHLGAGSTGAALNAAGSAGDPWTTPLPGEYGTGTAGKIIGSNLDAAISSRSTLDAAGVWGYATRTLSSFGTLVADIWAATGRTLTGFGTLVADIWGNVSRSLTDKAGFSLSGTKQTLDALHDATQGATKAELDAAQAALEAAIGEIPAPDLSGLALEANVQGHAAAALTAYDPPTKAELDLAQDAIETALSELVVPAPEGVALEANVQGHVADALAAYDPPTEAEMVAALAELPPPDLSALEASLGALVTAALAEAGLASKSDLVKALWARWEFDRATGIFRAYDADGQLQVTGAITASGGGVVRSVA